MWQRVFYVFEVALKKTLPWIHPAREISMAARVNSRSAAIRLIVTIAAVVELMLSSPLAIGALVTSHVDASSTIGATVDGTIGGSEYNGYSYSGASGSGSSFGGTLGSGTLFFESDATNLYVGASIAGNLGTNIIAVFLDTKSGGFSNDSTLGDTVDGGRAVASKLTRDVQDNFPIAADYVLEFGNGFTNMFELKTSSLNYIPPVSAGTGGQGSGGSREASISLSTLSLTPGSNVDFFAVLISDTQFASSEGIPGPQLINNPGFDNLANGGGPVTWPNFDRFTIASVPESSALLTIPVALLVTALGARMARRLRKPS